MADFKERLTAYIVDDLCLNINQFEIRSGIGRGVIARNAGLSVSNMQKISEAFPDIDWNYLIKGTRNSVPTESPTTSSTSDVLIKEMLAAHRDTIDTQKIVIAAQQQLISILGKANDR